MITRSELDLAWRLFRYDADRQRKRIALTVLAIAWGTITFVLLLAFGEGLKRQLAKGTRGMGEGICVVWGGATSKPYMGLPAGRRLKLRQEDVALLRARVSQIGAISAEYENWQTPMTVGKKTVSHRLQGVDPEYGPLRNMIPRPGGRFLNEMDQGEKRRVVVLGHEIAEEIFGPGVDPVGQELLVRGSTFLVVGVLEKKIQTAMYAGPDATAASIPASTFVSLFGAGRQPSNFVYRASRPELADTAQAEVFRVLAGVYRFDPTDKPALRLWDTRENQRITDNITLGVQLFLGTIGALTVLIGGMGVANIMYALVKERTREIGLKMALGARISHVMLPFVFEALIMTVLGGLLGTTVSVLIVKGVAALPLEAAAFEFLGKPAFSPAIAVGTSLVIGSIGLMAGYLPARRAAAVNPAVSLRYE
jgi:putative ABC transport system permease protein